MPPIRHTIVTPRRSAFGNQQQSQQLSPRPNQQHNQQQLQQQQQQQQQQHNQQAQPQAQAQTQQQTQPQQQQQQQNDPEFNPNSELEASSDINLMDLDKDRIHGIPTFGVNNELEVIHDGPGGDGEEPYILYVSCKFSRRMAQIVLDQVFEQNYHLFPQKRGYDNRKFGNLFDGDGPRIYNHLITACKMVFLRYLTVPDGIIYDLIKDAVGRDVDAASVEYSMPYQRIQEWRKNWLQHYLEHAEVIQKDLCTKLGWQDTAPNRQLKIYMGKFSTSYVDQLFSQVIADQMDWRRTLLNRAVHTFYKNIFAWTMVYVHRSKYPPPDGGQIITRNQLYAHIKTIALAEQFNDTFTDTDYITKPPKPATAQRRAKAPKPTDPLDLDPDFHIVPDDEESEEPQGDA